MDAILVHDITVEFVVVVVVVTAVVAGERGRYSSGPAAVAVLDELVD